MALTAEYFWQASLYIYQQNGIQPHLLALQDEQGLNVNLELLRMLLSGEESAVLDVASPQLGQPLSDAEYQQLHTIVMRFSRTYTQQVRTLRRQLTDQQAHPPLTEKSRKQLKSQLLAAELGLEKEEQALLLRSLTTLRQVPGAES